MERLVIKDGKGNLYFYDTERGVKLESYEVQPLQRREVLERLYEYEGTGLTPEEILELKEATQRLDKIFGDEITADQVIDFFVDFYIAQGDDGRVEAAELLTNEEAERYKRLKERDTAKAAIITGYNRAIGCKVGECPKCGTMTRDYMNFCSECGQRLRWEA